MGTRHTLLSEPTVLLTIAVLVAGGGVRTHAQAVPLTDYAAATLAPARVGIPQLVLTDGRLHALLVELATGTPFEALEQRLGLGREETERLLRLAEVEGLGRRLPDGGWQALAPALDRPAFNRLKALVEPLAVAIADTLEARWSQLAGRFADLPVAGRIPLERSGFVLLGAWLLGIQQADYFWQAGLAPIDRDYAFRVYRVPPEEAPDGLRIDGLGAGWRLAAWAPDARPFGLGRLLDPEDPLTRELTAVDTTAAPPVPARPDDGPLLELVRAYRLWYLMDQAPDAPTRRLLVRLEMVTPSGEPLVPLVSAADVEAIRSLAGDLGGVLWPALRGLIPELGTLAAELGYGEPGLLGEFTLWSWELAVQSGLRRLGQRGRLWVPADGRVQVLLMPERP